MRILIVKLGSIGDIVHALPVLSAIRDGLPGAEISWVVEKRMAEILRDNPLIDDLIEADTSEMRGRRALEGIVFKAGRQVRELRSFGFDIALDLQGLVKSGLIARLSGAKVRYGFSRSALREGAARVFYTDAVDVPGETHIVRKNLLLAAAALGIAVPSSGFDFPIETDAEDAAEAAALIRETGGRPFAVFNPGGGWVTKLWPAEKFGELADRLWDDLGMVSLLTTGPGESALATRAVENCRSNKLIPATPSLKGFYELTKRTSVYVGGDTGPTHIAVAAGAPVVGLFGPTEWWRNGSTDPDDICVDRTDIECRIDCHRRTCSNWICMEADVETVYAAVRTRLGSIPAPVITASYADVVSVIKNT